jgi:hypothetical protein
MPPAGRHALAPPPLPRGRGREAPIILRRLLVVMFTERGDTIRLEPSLA